MTPSLAAADTLKCARAIASAGTVFAQKTLVASQRCEESVMRGRIAGPCPDSRTAAKLVKIDAKLIDVIRRNCGGRDRLCGVGGDDSLTAIGWNIGQCPTIVGGAQCSNAIANCSDIATCLDCVAGTIADDARTLAFGAFAVSGHRTPLGKCQSEIGKQWSTFLGKRMRLLQACEDRVFKGRISGPCPDARTAQGLDRLEAKLERPICRKCGGPNKVCDGADDLTPAAIGFAANCPNVTIPGGASCGGAITTLPDLIGCLECVGQFDSVCLTRLAAPAVASYPAECYGATPLPTPTATPTPTPSVTSTPDLTPPTLDSTVPDDGATGICTIESIYATFSEPMDPDTITTATFTLTVTAGAPVAGAVTYDALTNTARFNPDVALTGNPATNYTATIVGGLGGVTDVAGNPLGVNGVAAFTTDAEICTPPLGAVALFGGVGGSATLTNDGTGTVINGDIGVNAASSAVTGLRDSGGNVYTVTPTNDGLVTGFIHTLTAPPGSVAGAVVTRAHSDALHAFNNLSPASLPGGIDVSDLFQCPSCGGAMGGPDELAGRTLPPGVYLSTTGTYDIGGQGRTVGNLTLDGGGDANAVWIFQTAAGTGTLNVGLTGPAIPMVPIQVLLVNSAQAKNVFWYVPAGATIGTGATMAGTMLADASITISTTGTPPIAPTTTLNGRAIALTAGVTMTNTVINVPAP